MNDVLFSLGGMWFEYNEEKNQGNIKSMESPSEALHVCSLIMTGLNYMMRKTAWMKIGLIRSEIHRPERFLSAVL